MRVFVSGGAGFIGSHLTERLLARGHAVLVYDNLSTGKWENLPVTRGDLEFIQGDIRNASLVSELMQGMDAAVHLAAVASVQASIDDPVTTHQTNFDGTVNMLQAARQDGINRFLYASSAAVYGDTAEIPVSEDAIPNPLSPYAADKLAGEECMLDYYNRFGIEATSFRFFNIYGPRQDPTSPYSGVISIFVDRLLKNKPVTIFGDGAQTRDFVYVSDLVDLLVMALEEPHGAGGIFNVGTGMRHSLLELLDNLEKLSGKKIERRQEPARSGDILHSCADITRLRQIFKSVPSTPFDLGLKKLLESLTPK
jgi:UDP-glucose 4-epimerase